MSRKHWTYVFAAFGITAGCSISHNACAQNSSAQNHSRVADNVQPSSAATIESSLARIASTAEAIQNRPESQAENQRAREDLKAQKDMARWALGAMFAAIFTVLLSAAGLLLIWRTLVQTRRAANFTGEAVTEAQKTTKLAERSLYVTQDVAETDLRAWISVDLTMKNVRRNDKFVIVGLDAALKNIGKTPALRVAVSVDAYIIPSAITNYGVLPELDKRQTQLSALLPSAGITHAEGFMIKKVDVEEAMEKCKSAGFPPMIVIDVVAFYHTVFDTEDASKRHTSIRYYVVGKVPPGASDRSAQWQWLNKGNVLGFLDSSFAQDKSAPVYLT